MAELRMAADAALNVALTPLEKLAALHGDLRLPLSAVTEVDVIDQPLDEVRGIRAPGLHIPGRFKIGTWRGRGRRIFAVARAGQAAVRIELAGAGYDAVIVSLPDAAAVADRLRESRARP